MNINLELIPNKQILSFENWGDMEGKPYLLSVTRGMASRKQKQVCYQRFVNELSDRDTMLNDKFFKRNNNYELWCKKELIGLCHNTAKAQDWLEDAKNTGEDVEEKDIGTLFLTCSLNTVFILNKYRGNGIGDYFSRVIRQAQWRNLLGLLAQLETNIIKHVNVLFFCEYVAKGGENFHMQLFSGSKGAKIKSIIKQLGYSYETHIIAGY